MIRQMMRLLAPSSSISYNIPDKSWFDYVRESSKYTPDIAKLEEHDFQLYFACDETQYRHTKHVLLGEAINKCPGFTQKSFNYWDSTESPWLPPVPMEASGYRNVMPNYPDIAKIKGQVLLIRPQAFLKLDEYKENGVQYRREKARIIVPYRALKFLKDAGAPPEDIEQVLSGSLGLTYEKIYIIRAWMYVGVPEYWDKIISSFDFKSVKTFEAKNRAWCRTYYQYREASPPK